MMTERPHHTFNICTWWTTTDYMICQTEQPRHTLESGSIQNTEIYTNVGIVHQRYCCRSQRWYWARFLCGYNQYTISISGPCGFDFDVVPSRGSVAPSKSNHNGWWHWGFNELCVGTLMEKFQIPTVRGSDACDLAVIGPVTPAINHVGCQLRVNFTKVWSQIWSQSCLNMFDMLEIFELQPGSVWTDHQPNCKCVANNK